MPQTYLPKRQGCFILVRTYAETPYVGGSTAHQTLSMWVSIQKLYIYSPVIYKQRVPDIVAAVRQAVRCLVANAMNPFLREAPKMTLGFRCRDDRAATNKKIHSQNAIYVQFLVQFRVGNQ